MMNNQINKSENIPDNKRNQFAARLKSNNHDDNYTLFTFIVLDCEDASNSKIKKTFRFVSELLSHGELYGEENNYNQNGKLHLIVAMKETDPDEDSMPDKIPENRIRFGDIFKSITTPDVFEDMITIETADDEKLVALKLIISKKSPVFDAMFKNGWKSGEDVKVNAFTGKVIGELLRFMYFGEVNSIGTIDIDLYAAAVYYQVMGLKEICLESIESRIDISNAFEVIQFAETHDVKGLYGISSEIICR